MLPVSLASVVLGHFHGVGQLSGGLYCAARAHVWLMLKLPGQLSGKHGPPAKLLPGVVPVLERGKLGIWLHTSNGLHCQIWLAPGNVAPVDRPRHQFGVVVDAGHKGAPPHSVSGRYPFRSVRPGPAGHPGGGVGSNVQAGELPARVRLSVCRFHCRLPFCSDDRKLLVPRGGHRPCTREAQALLRSCLLDRHRFHLFGPSGPVFANWSVAGGVGVALMATRMTSRPQTRFVGERVAIGRLGGRVAISARRSDRPAPMGRNEHRDGTKDCF